MTDAEWTSLPVDTRMWAVDQARRCLDILQPLPHGFVELEEHARGIAAIVTRGPVGPSSDDVSPVNRPAPWREERGLG